MRRTARLALTTAIAATPVLGLATPATLLPSASAAVASINHVRLNGFEARLVVEINHARLAAGLRPLRVVPGATDVARRWAWRLADAQRLWHNPRLVQDMVRGGARDWTMVAENVGFGPAQQPHTLFEAYMHSPEHRANILDHSARYLGVGVVERDGLAYNTLDFTDAWSSAYGPTRVPAAGLTMDEQSITGTTDVARLESGLDQRFTARGHGGVSASRIAFTGPTAGNDAAYTVIRRTSRHAGHAAIIMQDALDLSQATSLALQLSAHDRNGRAVPVRVVLRRAFGGSVDLGTVPVGAQRQWVRLPLPASAQSFRTELVLQVRGADVAAAGGRVRLSTYDVRADA
ncbi:MAG TPA: CAP domain-containing protein [Mycobacteriales bacterium]|nr:CAP domain-containing protein [Mycobacteriales bacterium]